MKSFCSNIVFCIARKWRVSTMAKTFVITFRICSVNRILPWIVLIFFPRQLRNIKKVISLLKTSSVPCLNHTLKLLNKDSLFEDNCIKLLLAKKRKLVYHSSHSLKASKIIKTIQINLKQN